MLSRVLNQLLNGFEKTLLIKKKKQTVDLSIQKDNSEFAKY